MGGQKFADFARPRTAAHGSSASAATSTNQASMNCLWLSAQEMIYDVGGGIPNGRKLKAVVPGGSSTFILSAEEAEQMNMDLIPSASEASSWVPAAL